MKLFYLLLTILSLSGLCTQQFHVVNAVVSIPDLSIPFEGMTLKWLFNATGSIGTMETGSTKTGLYKYTKRLSETKFEVTQLLPEEEKETYEIDTNTREIVSGSEEGNFTSHWIPTDISIGDEINISDTKFTVASKNEEVYLPSINHDTSIKCIRLEHVESISGIDVTISHFYDVNVGLKVKTVGFGQGFSGILAVKVSIEGNIIETGIDNDQDELTDCQELFVTLTNPQKADTDGDNLSDKSEIELGTNPLTTDSDMDFWSDDIDFMPNNSLMPNGVIISLAVIVTSGIIAYKLLKKRKSLTKIESQPDAQKS